MNSLKSLSKIAFLSALIFFVIWQTSTFQAMEKRHNWNSTEAEMIQKFRERIDRGDIENIELTYRISGGIPAQGKLEEEVTIFGSNNLVTVKSNSGTALSSESSEEIKTAEVQNLLQKVEKSTDSLIPRTQARFLPDSIVGSITIKIEGERETFYFSVEEDRSIEKSSARLTKRFVVSPGMTEAVDAFSQLSQQLLERN